MLTYEMAHRPDHIGIKKAWLTWHSQNLEEFRQRQPVVLLKLIWIVPSRHSLVSFTAHIHRGYREIRFASMFAYFQIAQDEIIRRFVRGFFPDYITIDGSELIIKRQGNCVRVAGFLHYKNRLNIREVYWMFGFAEEFLSILLKQPVKLEMQFLPDEKELAYKYI